MYCSNCGAKRVDGQRFCSNCGTSFVTHVNNKSYGSQTALAIILGVVSFVGLWIPIIGFILAITTLAIAFHIPSREDVVTGKYIAVGLGSAALITAVFAFLYWMQVNAAYFQ